MEKFLYIWKNKSLFIALLENKMSYLVLKTVFIEKQVYFKIK
jgi:hypothetical protein